MTADYKEGEKVRYHGTIGDNSVVKKDYIVTLGRRRKDGFFIDCSEFGGSQAWIAYDCEILGYADGDTVEEPKAPTTPSCKFKKGDKIRRTSDGKLDTVKSVPGMVEYDEQRFCRAKKGFVSENTSWEWLEDWELVEEKEIKTVHEIAAAYGTFDTATAGFTYGIPFLGESALTTSDLEQLCSEPHLGKWGGLLKKLK